MSPVIEGRACFVEPLMPPCSLTETVAWCLETKSDAGLRSARPRLVPLPSTIADNLIVGNFGASQGVDNDDG